MSKIIKITEEMSKKCIEEFAASLAKAGEDFEKYISSAKISNGKIDFSFPKYMKDFGTQNRKATLEFSEIAWHKMKTLVQEYSSEIAWHGIARRDEDEDSDVYYIDDILIYPQMVDGTNVNTEQIKYQDWLYSLDDYTFNNLRMQGHSHVNMGVSPSSVDEMHQEKILSQLDEDMFYIFIIINKYDAKNIRIYDLKKNALFDTSDVDVIIRNDDIGIENMINDAKKAVERKTYTSYQTNVKSQVAIPPSSTVKKEPVKGKKKESFGTFSNNSSYYYDEMYGYQDDGYSLDKEYEKRYGVSAKDPFYSYDGYASNK